MILGGSIEDPLVKESMLLHEADARLDVRLVEVPRRECTVGEIIVIACKVRGYWDRLRFAMGDIYRVNRAPERHTRY